MSKDKVLREMLLYSSHKMYLVRFALGDGNVKINYIRFLLQDLKIQRLFRNVLYFIKSKTASIVRHSIILCTIKIKILPIITERQHHLYNVSQFQRG